jgi:hypothetical protein
VLKIFVIQRYEASLAQTKTVPNPRVAAAGIAEKGRKLTPDLSEQRGLPGKGSACFDLSRNSSAKITILQQFRHTARKNRADSAYRGTSSQIVGDASG